MTVATTGTTISLPIFGSEVFHVTFSAAAGGVGDAGPFGLARGTRWAKYITSSNTKLRLAVTVTVSTLPRRPIP